MLSLPSSVTHLYNTASGRSCFPHAPKQRPSQLHSHSPLVETPQEESVKQAPASPLTASPAHQKLTEENQVECFHALRDYLPSREGADINYFLDTFGYFTSTYTLQNQEKEFTFFLTEPQWICPQKIGLVACIRFQDERGFPRVFTRVFYHSSSQGIWRTLPNSQKKENGELGVFGKGLDEASCSLPLSLSISLNHLLNDCEKKLVKSIKTPPPRSFPTVRNQWEPFESFVDGTTPTQLDGQSFEEDAFLCRNEYGTVEEPKSIPLPDDAGQAPDFTYLVQEGSYFLPLYGEVTYQLFPSEDQALLYLFHKSGEEVYLAGVELSAESNTLSNYGCWETYLKTDQTAPLFEHPQQIPNQYDEEFLARQSSTDYSRPEPSQNPITQAVGEDKYTSQKTYIRDLPFIEAYHAYFSPSRPLETSFV